MVEPDATVVEGLGIELGTYLGRHGLAARIEQIRPAGRTVPEALLEAADLLGSNWLVMGAYGHNRFREHIFGGATYDVVRDAPVPILLAH